MPALPTLMQPLHAPSASLHHAFTSTHTEGQHLQVAPNLQVAKALRQCCQLIVAQDPATVTAPLPISITAPCMHKHIAHTEGQHLQVVPNLEIAKALRQSCQLISGEVLATGITPPPISVT